MGADTFVEEGIFSGHITDEVINEYINKHTDAHLPQSISNIRLE